MDMDTWSTQIHTMITETDKIRMRMQYLKFVTYRITVPDIVDQLEDRVELYRSLDSLNQLIDAYQLQFEDVENEVEKQVVLHNSVRNSTTFATSMVPQHFFKDTTELVDFLIDFREDMTVSVQAAHTILDCFLEETSH